MFLGMLFFLICIWAILSIVFWSLKNGIVPMPSSFKAKSCLLKTLPKITEGKIYELGSGWGTLAFPISNKYPDSQVIGYETSTIPYAISCGLKRVYPSPNLTFIKKDFFKISLDDAALIVCYLYPEAMRVLKTKFEDELKPGTWIISNTFAIPGWAAEQIFEVNDIYRTKIYLYLFK